MKIFKSTLLQILILFISFTQSFIYAELNNNSQDAIKILIVSAYSSDFETYSYIMSGLKSELDAYNALYHTEFMDTKNHPEKENVENFYNSLKYKLSKSEKYDFIVVADDNALNFVYAYKDDIFKGIPVVFLGINDDENVKKISKNPNFTGVIESISLGETIDMIHDVTPDVQNVVAIFDNTYTSHVLKEDYQAHIIKRSDYVFQSIDLTTLTFDEAFERLDDLGATDVVLLFSFIRDKAGHSLSFKEGIKKLLNHAERPIFHLFEHGIEDGLMGGYVVSHYQQGKKAGQIIKRILSGDTIAEIQPIDSPNRPILNYNVLAEYSDISQLDLSKFEVVGKKLSFVEQYYGLVIAVSCLIVLQTVLIMTLYTFMKKAKNVEKKLKIKKKMLEESNSTLVTKHHQLKEAFTEINSKKRHIDQLLNTDILTRLSTRYYIKNVLEYKIKNGQCLQIGVVFIDVDNFKDINDSFGHDFGDKILKAIGQRLTYINGSNTAIGRFGGDEFIVIIDQMEQSDQVLATVEKIRSYFREELIVEGRSFYINLSMGIAMYPNQGQSTVELIKKADVALYEAKKRGKNRFIFYDKNLEKSLEDKITFQTHIKEAYKNNEFVLYYQPYYHAATRDIMGFEALIRWHSPTLGTVSPYNLITTLEKMGFITEVGLWIVKESCKFLKAATKKKSKSLTMSINISALQIIHSDFCKQVTQIVEDLNIDPANISFEVTETVFLESQELWRPKFNQLIRYGFKLSIDDFGTGYSSLSYFKNIPASIIKIDKVFVDNIVDDVYNKYFIETIINLAHACGKRVIAEGVETKEQYEVLVAHNCDAVQGYYFSKPLPEHEAQYLLSD